MKLIAFGHLLLLTFITTFSTYNYALAGTKQMNQSSIQKKMSDLEVSADGRLGISVINTANNQHIHYRAQERFPMGSTYKVMLVAAILKQSMTNDQLLKQKITYTKQDIETWSPITEKHFADGMTISELCAATIMYSDNTAANLLMKEFGGPKAITAFARSIGDSTYSLDRREGKMNSIPDDFEYTTTPMAMEKTLKQLLLGNVLAPPQRKQLINWMKGNTTGDLRIRAGAPKGWIVADKTGSGDYGLTNDIGIIYPPKCKPLVVSIYFMQNKKDATGRPDVIASATRILINELARTDLCVK